MGFAGALVAVSVVIAVGYVWVNSLVDAEVITEPRLPDPQGSPDRRTGPTSMFAAPPGPGASWQIQLDGGVPLATGAQIVEVDWQVPAHQVTQLNEAGAYTVCYFSAGSWEDWRPDASDYPESVLGEQLDDWPGERYVDLRDLAALGPLWAARLDACAAAGFDAVDPDNMDAYSNPSGFGLTEDDSAGAFVWLSEQAHARGLAIALKNSPEIADRVLGAADLAVVEECLTHDFCDAFVGFVEAGKPVLLVEYIEDGASLSTMCAPARELGLSLLVHRLALDGEGEACP